MMPLGRVSLIMTFFLLFGFSSSLKGQIVFDITEDDLIESQWEYIEARHPETNLVIHQAGENFDYAVYFRFNGEYRSLLNGQTRLGRWRMDGRTLMYDFNGVKEFVIVGLTDDEMTLQYESPYTGQKTHYFFSTVIPSKSPFKGSTANLLPRVLVDENEKKEVVEEASWWKKFLGLFKKERKTIPEPYIRIEMTGGGYYGGINRVVKDYILIDNNGVLIKEIHTEHQGLYKQTVKLDRSMLLEFMDFVSKKGFFDTPRIIDCKDLACERRIRQKPVPVPLRLSITYGERTNIISISIWGKDHYNTKWVDYPKEIDAIIFAIQNMAHSAM